MTTPLNDSGVTLQWQQRRRELRLLELADELGVRLHWVTTHDDLEAKRGVALVVPCAEQFDYLGDLHELGHIACGHPALGDPSEPRLRRVRLDLEAEAWRWAFAHAREPLEHDTLRHVASCIGSYWNLAGPSGQFGLPGEAFYGLATDVRLGLAATATGRPLQHLGREGQ